MNQADIKLMIESLEELNEELSNQNKGTLFTEQWELIDSLKKELKAQCVDCAGNGFIVKENHLVEICSTCNGCYK